ncbi:MAG: hypothetical protein ACFB20_07595 [Opitutales bacterium]
MKKYTRLLRAGFAATLLLGLSPLCAQFPLDFEGLAVGTVLNNDTSADFGFDDDNTRTFEISGTDSGSAVIVDIAGDKKVALVTQEGSTFEDAQLSFTSGGFNGTLRFKFTIFDELTLGFSTIDSTGDLVIDQVGSIVVFFLGAQAPNIRIETDGIRMTGAFSNAGKVFYSDVGFVDNLEVGVEYELTVIVDSGNNQLSVAIDNFIIINRVSPNTGSLGGFGEIRIQRDNTNTPGDATILIDDIERPGFPFIFFPAPNSAAFAQADNDDANGNSGSQPLGADFTTDGDDLVRVQMFDFSTDQAGLESFNFSPVQVGLIARWPGEATADLTGAPVPGVVVNGNDNPDRINFNPAVINGNPGEYSYLIMLPTTAFTVPQDEPYAFDGTTEFSIVNEFTALNLLQAGTGDPINNVVNLDNKSFQWVVRNGDTFWINRDESNTGGFGTFSLSDPNNANWVTIDPTTMSGFADISIDTTGGAPVTFDDVQGVGFYVELSYDPTVDTVVAAFDSSSRFTVAQTAALSTITFEQWISGFTDNTSDPTAARDGDLDGDGCNNLAEFMFGGDPTDPLSKNLFEDFVISEGRMYYLLSVRQNSAGGEVVDFVAGDDLTVVSTQGFGDVDGTILALLGQIVEDDIISQDFRIVIAEAAQDFGSADQDFIQARVTAEVP